MHAHSILTVSFTDGLVVRFLFLGQAYVRRSFSDLSHLAFVPPADLTPVLDLGTDGACTCFSSQPA